MNRVERHNHCTFAGMNKVMRTILWGCIVFIGLPSFAQNDTINQVDAQGRKQGYWTKDFEHGIKRYEGHFKDGQPIGKFTYYYDDGKLQSTVEFINGHAYSHARHYDYDTGNLMADGFYAGQAKDSLWKLYDPQGVHVATERYNKGVPHGKWENFYLNGQLAESKVFNQGMEQGQMTRYFDNGQLKYDAKFIDGNPDGTVKFYYSSGVLKTIGSYSSAVKHGKWTYFGSDGQVRVEEVWERGKLITQKVDGEEVDPQLMYQYPDSSVVIEKVIGVDGEPIEDDWESEVDE